MKAEAGIQDPEKSDNKLVAQTLHKDGSISENEAEVKI
jgi:hypothetical protein